MELASGLLYFGLPITALILGTVVFVTQKMSTGQFDRRMAHQHARRTRTPRTPLVR